MAGWRAGRVVRNKHVGVLVIVAGGLAGDMTMQHDPARERAQSAVDEVYETARQIAQVRKGVQVDFIPLPPSRRDRIRARLLDCWLWLHSDEARADMLYLALVGVILIGWMLFSR